MTFIRLYFLFSALIFLSSCTDRSPHFVIEGSIADADSMTLYLEKRELNNFRIIDSVLLDNSGKFHFKGSALPYPEFFVLKLNNQLINLAIDSTETISINASMNNFATEYTIMESSVNEQIKTLILAKYNADKAYSELKDKYIKHQISESQYNFGLDTLNREYKELASKIILTDLKSPVAYFALFQKVQNYLFFDPYDKNDSKIVTAVANAWDFYYPQSPRSAQLKKFALEAMKIRKQNEIGPINLDNVISDENEYFNIELPDVNNKTVSLNSLRGKTIILDFILYQSEVSPQHNMMLNSIYSKYKDKVEIYQVSFDTDKHLWQNAASNIPWIAVYDNLSLNSPLIARYNINNLPVTYILDKEGQIKKRVKSTKALEGEVSKLF